MSFETLISTESLAAVLATPDLVVVDCRFKLDDLEWGPRMYAAGTIPGARFADVERELSGPKDGTNGRHPLPAPDILRATLTRLGISHRSQVVAFDQDLGMYASRLWWLLRWLGHRRVAVLDGGFAAWIGEGRPTTPGNNVERKLTDAPFTGEPRQDMIADAADVARIIRDPEWRLVDARAPERFRGEVEPVDRVAGHIPSAVNHFFGTNVKDGRFLAADVLRKHLEATLAGAQPDRVVCYCGSGVTACQDILAFEHAGLAAPRLYPGSWSEWCSDPGRPVSRGE